MSTAKLGSALLVLLVLVVGAGPARAETMDCTPITTLPFLITVQGVYCLTANLSTATTPGTAIDIQTNNVVVDLNGFTLSGLGAGPGTTAVGIHALNRQNITLKNGTIRGFLRGIWLEDAGGSQGHLVADIRADQNTFVGMQVEGAGTLVSTSQAVATGGTTTIANADAIGILAVGAGPRVVDNDVINTVKVGTGTAVGMQFQTGTAGGLAADNRITGADKGIEFLPGATGKCRGNLTFGVTTPFVGCTDASSGKLAQTISFTSAAPASATVGGATYTVTATATSGLAATFTIDAAASTVCSIAGSTVSFIGVGTCVINANQAGDATYDPAPQVQQSFAVGQGSQTITFTSVAPGAATVGGPTYLVTATATSGLAVAFTIDAAATTKCSIVGSTVSFTAVGTCVINANQAGDATYNAAPQVQQSFAVGKGSQTITFTSTAPSDATVGGPTYNVTATASSGLVVAFTIDASASTKCSIAGSTVSFGPNGGTCVINANQAGDATYNAAPQVQQSFGVTQAPAITSAANTTFAPGKAGQTFNVTTTGFPTNASMSITETPAMPSGTTFTNNNNGTATIAGTPAAGTQSASPYTLMITANNGVAPNATQNFTFNIVCPAITVSGTIPALTFNTAMATATFTQSNGNGTITWSSSGLPTNTSINSANGQVTGTPNVTGTFNVTITATDAGGCTGSTNQSVTVAPVAVGDAYSGLVDNTQFVITGGSTGSPTTPFVGATGKITTNDLPSVGVTATAGTFATSGGGSVTIANDGTFIYTPKANPTAAATTSDSFTYTVFSNTGGGAAVTSAPSTVNLTLAGRVWYVLNNGAAGNGQSQSTFNTLAAAVAASTANDFIFVYRGDGTTTNLATASILKAGQSLIGQGVALVVNSNTLVAAGSFPLIGSTVTLANSVTVTGLDMDGASVALTGSSITGFTVNIGRFRRTGSSAATAINLSGSGNTGTFDFKSVSITGASGSSANKGVSISNLTGHFTVAGTDTVLTPDGGTVSGYGGNGMEFINVKNGTNTAISLLKMTLDDNGKSQNAFGTAANQCGIADLHTGNNVGCVANLYLKDTDHVVFDQMTISNGDQMGINGNNVTHFTLTKSSVTGNGGEAFESGVVLQGLLGTGANSNLIEDCDIRDNEARQIHVDNGSGSSQLDVKKNTGTMYIGNTSRGGTNSQQGLLVDVNGTFTLNVDQVTVKNNVNNGVDFLGRSSAVLSGHVNASVFDINGAAVDLQTIGGNTTFDIMNNTQMTGNTVQAINVANGAGATGTLLTKITGNTIGIFNNASGVSACDPGAPTPQYNCTGIAISEFGGTVKATITGNQMHQIGGTGMNVTASGGTTAVTISGNTIDQPGNVPGAGGNAAGSAILVNMGSLAAVTACADIKTNTIGSTDFFNTGFGWDANGAGTDFLVRTRNSSVTSIPNLTGGTTAANVATFIHNAQTSGGTTTAQAQTSGTFAVGGANCGTP